MAIACVDQLLRENQTALLCERRANVRKPFVRPVKVVTGYDQNESHDGFSRDISAQGIGVISRVQWQPKTIATIKIHRLRGSEVAVRAEARWSEPYGDGWYLAGWLFLN